MDNSKDLLIENSQCRLQEAFKTKSGFQHITQRNTKFIRKFLGVKSTDGLNGQSKNTEQHQEQHPTLPQVRHNRR